MQRGKCNCRYAAYNRQLPDNMRHAAGNMQRTTNDMQPETGNMQHAPDFKQHAADNNDMQRARKHAACSMQQTTDNVEKTADSVQRTTDNKATENEAKYVRRQTSRRKLQATGNACNRYRATDSRRHARGREHMPQETHGTAAFRVRRAAGSGRAAACAKHGTRQPVRNTTRKMQHTTGAAACSKHTRNRHHAAGIETYEMRRSE